MTHESHYWEITGHFGRTHHEHHNGSWCWIRLVLVWRFEVPETWCLQTFARSPLWPVLRTTARIGGRFGHFTWWLKEVTRTVSTTGRYELNGPFGPPFCTFDSQRKISKNLVFWHWHAFRCTGYYNISPLGTFVLECGLSHMINRVWATNKSTNLWNSINMQSFNSTC